MAAIRGRWAGKQRTTAVAIYQTLTELANEARGDRFRSARKEVGRRSGTTSRTVDAYASGFEELGLLRRHREKREDGLNLPNEWELLGGSAAKDTTPGEAKSTTGSAAKSTHVQEEQRQEEKTPVSPTRKNGRNPERNAEIRDVFDHFCHHYSPRAKLDPKRAKRINARLEEEFTVADLKLAITNAERDDWLAGRKNGSGGYLRKLHTLLRDREMVENLIALAPADDPASEDIDTRAIRQLREQGLHDEADEEERG